MGLISLRPSLKGTMSSSGIQSDITIESLDVDESPLSFFTSHCCTEIIFCYYNISKMILTMNNGLPRCNYVMFNLQISSLTTVLSNATWITNELHLSNTTSFLGTNTEIGIKYKLASLWCLVSCYSYRYSCFNFLLTETVFAYCILLFALNHETDSTLTCINAAIAKLFTWGRKIKKGLT